ncbi:MAG: hypothetical protein LW595_03755 [Rickettsiales bacterium]|nr:hypothetical protein [Rickettsiales bacterium]
MIKYLTIILVIMAFGCSKFSKQNDRKDFIISNSAEINQFEASDHELCSIIANNNEIKNLKNQTNYWKCRISTTKSRIDSYSVKKNHSKTELEIIENLKKLIEKIFQKLINISDEFIIEKNQRINKIHHDQCQEVLGIKNRDITPATYESYLNCRKSLLKSYESLPAFGKLSYLKYPNKSYNLINIVKRNIDEDILNQKIQNEEYPECSKFNIKSRNFKNCIELNKKSKQCFSEIVKKRFLQEVRLKAVCHQQAYSRFPYELLKKSIEFDFQEEQKNKLIFADDKNKSSFYSLGLNKNDIDKFQSKINEEKSLEAEEKNIDKNKEKQEDKKDQNSFIFSKDEELKIANSTKNLYSKPELVAIQQKYIEKCIDNKELELSKFNQQLEEDCENINKDKKQ